MNLKPAASASGEANAGDDNSQQSKQAHDDYLWTSSLPLTTLFSKVLGHAL